jgi:hypothetical protein
MVGLQELGNCWSLIVGAENFIPISEFIRDLNQAIAHESLRDEVEVTRSKHELVQNCKLILLDMAHLLCDAHDVVFDMISQFKPTKPINDGNKKLHQTIENNAF